MSETQHPGNTPSQQFESEFEANQYQLRRDKLAQIAQLAQKSVTSDGPSLPEAAARYPSRFPATRETGDLDSIPALRRSYDFPSHPVSAEQLDADKPRVRVAGRLMSLRLQGKTAFAHLQGGGERLQIYIRRDAVGDDLFALVKLLDLGDHIGVSGYLFRTRTGELSIHVGSGPTGEPALTFLTKALLALPDKYHGLEDTELRYRQRYVDLFMNTGDTVKQVTHAPASTNSPEAPGPEATHDLSSRSEHSTVEGPASSTAADNAGTDPGNVREVFVKRAAILRSIRRFFDQRGYLEVETPMMHTVAGGAAARPFKTHHNALDIDLSLRIAPELFLKRLVVGGLDRVYEINRNFRNEGVSTRHNPEFTMLEFYQAYSDYHDLMDLTEELVTTVATEVNGTPTTHFNGHEIDLSKWQRLSMREAIIKFWPDFATRPAATDLVSVDTMVGWLQECVNAYGLGGSNASLEGARRFTLEKAEKEDRQRRLQTQGDPLQQAVDGATYEITAASRGKQSIGKAIATLFEALAEPHLIQPTIIYDFPLAVSPLSKQKPDDPDWVERFEFYIGGFEVGNAFSELNDPVEQRKRFEDQLKERDRGDDEAHAMDEDYVRALGYGLPPTAGEGIGIDRLTMLLTGARSIRDVILFPLLRPQPTRPGQTT